MTALESAEVERQRDILDIFKADMAKRYGVIRAIRNTCVQRAIRAKAKEGK